MKKLILLLIIVSHSIIAKPLVKQGSSVVSYDDIDGFAYTIPVIDRYGFFQSNKRLDNLIGSLLNMQHLINHATTEKIKIDYETIIKSAKSIASDKIASLGIEFNLANDFKIKLIEKYYTNKLTNDAVQQYYQDKNKNTDFLERAEELYSYNKGKYKVEKNYDLRFISFDFNANNIEIQKTKAKDILENLLNGTLTFEKVNKGLLKQYSYVEMQKTLKNYFYRESDSGFSEILFSQNKIGLVKEIYEINNRLVIFEIFKITPETLIAFDKVKTQIIEELRQEKFKRDYKVLIMSLTKDEIVLDDELIQSVKERYKDSE